MWQGPGQKPLASEGPRQKDQQGALQEMDQMDQRGRNSRTLLERTASLRRGQTKVLEWT